VITRQYFKHLKQLEKHKQERVAGSAIYTMCCTTGEWRNKTMKNIVYSFIWTFI